MGDVGIKEATPGCTVSNDDMATLASTSIGEMFGDAFDEGSISRLVVITVSISTEAIFVDNAAAAARIGDMEFDGAVGADAVGASV